MASLISGVCSDADPPRYVEYIGRCDTIEDSNQLNHTWGETGSASEN